MGVHDQAHALARAIKESPATENTEQYNQLLRHLFSMFSVV